jgi:hypothetical protein
MFFGPICESRRNRWGFACRILLVLLVAASFAVLQAESVVELHAHHHGGPNDHCCPGCHGGHYPILQTSGSIEMAALGFSEWHALPSSDASVSGTYRTLNSSRAPPA